MSRKDLEREQQELETTTMLKTMIIENDEDEETSILEELEQFEERIEYLDIPEEKKNKLIKLCNEIKQEEDENTREYLFKLLQKEAK